MMTKSLAMLLAAAALPAAASAAQESKAMDYGRRLAALSQIQRFAALRNAVIENGQRCRRVVAAAHQGPYKNLDMWVARCGPKPIDEYGLFLGPDGTVQVSTCADLVKVKWPACRKLP